MAEASSSFELIPSQDNSRFLVHHPLEIVRILRGLAQRKAMVSAFFNSGKESLLSVVLEVDAERRKVYLDCNANEELNQRLLQAGAAIFTSALDQVRIQFAAGQVQREPLQGTPAFCIPLPEQLLELQRRESFRLAMPVLHPVNCMLPLQPQQNLQLPIGDMSMGGLSVTLDPHVETPFQAGAIYPGCRIELPGTGSIEVTLRIQNLREVTLKNGKKSLRCGCQFLNLHPAMESQIQRYLFRLERDSITGHHHS